MAALGAVHVAGGIWSALGRLARKVRAALESGTCRTGASGSTKALATRTALLVVSAI